MKLVVFVYEGCMDKLTEVYKRGGLNITKIHCNNKILKVIDPILEEQYLTIKMNYAAGQEHSPQAE